MERIAIFEDLIAWQKARVLAARISAVTADSRYGRDWYIRNQLRAAAASTMSNIAEGFDRGRRGEFRQFLSIAKGSASEVRSLIHFSFDAKLLSAEEYPELLDLAREVARVIAGLRRAVAAGNDRRS